MKNPLKRYVFIYYCLSMILKIKIKHHTQLAQPHTKYAEHLWFLRGHSPLCSGLLLSQLLHLPPAQPPWFPSHLHSSFSDFFQFVESKWTPLQHFLKIVLKPDFCVYNKAIGCLHSWCVCLSSWLMGVVIYCFGIARKWHRDQHL